MTTVPSRPTVFPITCGSLTVHNRVDSLVFEAEKMNVQNSRSAYNSIHGYRSVVHTQTSRLLRNSSADAMRDWCTSGICIACDAIDDGWPSRPQAALLAPPVCLANEQKRIRRRLTHCPVTPCLARPTLHVAVISGDISHVSQTAARRDFCLQQLFTQHMDT